MRAADGHFVREAHCELPGLRRPKPTLSGAQDMRRLHGGAEPWARFHGEHNKNDDIEVKPWEPEVWTAESNWQCRREILSAKPINIPAWLCRVLGALLRTFSMLTLRVDLGPCAQPCVALSGR